MSTFLGPLVYQTIPASYAPLQVKTPIKTQLVNRGWQIKAEQDTTQPYTLDVIPPATEAIGNADAYEFLRMTTNDNIVSWQALKHWNRAFPQMMRIYGATAGNVAVTATVAGAAVARAITLTFNRLPLEF